MRTTLTLDDDVAHELRNRSRMTGSSFKQVVNDALRAGLQAGKRPGASPPSFRVTPKAAGFRSGVDILHLNRLVDELEADDAGDELRRAALRG
jgi:hypothetical protein